MTHNLEFSCILICNVSTVITGIEENPECLSSELKTKLGTGGTYKEGQIILQGNHIEDVKISIYLQAG